MEKRAYKRIPLHVNVRVLNGGSLHRGLVTNLSENGIYFISGANLSSGLNIEVSIPFNDDQLKVPIKIVRTIETGYLYDGFAAELLSQSQNYIEFVHSHNAP